MTEDSDPQDLRLVHRRYRNPAQDLLVTSSSAAAAGASSTTSSTANNTNGQQQQQQQRLHDQDDPTEAPSPPLGSPGDSVLLSPGQLSPSRALTMLDAADYRALHAEPSYQALQSLQSANGRLSPQVRHALILSLLFFILFFY